MVVKLFAIALSAGKNGKYQLHASIAVNCETVEEALKQASDMAFRIWPVKDGWSDHVCTVQRFEIAPVMKRG